MKVSDEILDNNLIDFIEKNYKEVLIVAASSVIKSSDFPKDSVKDQLVFTYRTMLMAVAVLAREEKIMFKRKDT